MAKYKSRSYRAGEQAAEWREVAENLRKATTPAEAVEALEALDCGELESLVEEITAWRDNMSSANMEHLPKYEEVETAASELEDIDADELMGLSGGFENYCGEGEDELQGELDDAADIIESAADVLEGVSFPGMF